MLADHCLLNPLLAAALAGAGHGELVVVADAGLHLPERSVIDLSLVPGIPKFLDVAGVIRRSLCVESAIVAEEMIGRPHHSRLVELMAPIAVEYVPHEVFKARISHARVVVRTGECTPYSNVAFRAGVTF